ncbi:hypothetical protein CR513_38879, partial [Mucuna pruriens]
MMMMMIIIVTTITGNDLSVNLVSDDHMWIIDISAILHVTLRKKFVTSYTSGDFGVLKMGNDDQDNQYMEKNLNNTIHLGKNSTFHSRSKYIDVRYHWICNALDAKLLELAKVNTDDNGADMMIKVVS